MSELKILPLDLSQLLDTPEVMSGYLKRSLSEDEDPHVLLDKLSAVIQSIAMSDMASRLGMSRDALYEVFLDKDKQKVGDLIQLGNRVCAVLDDVSEKKVNGTQEAQQILPSSYCIHSKAVAQTLTDDKSVTKKCRQKK